jgi:predicted RNase H-like HicB family nuclease
VSNAGEFGFYVGILADGAYVANSVAAPYFCFLGESEEDVIRKANGAFDFYLSGEGDVTPRPSTSNNVVNFVPQRRVTFEKGRARA